MYFLHYVGLLGCVKPCLTVDIRKILIQIHLKNDEAFQNDSSQVLNCISAASLILVVWRF